MIYQPSNKLTDRLARRLRPLYNRRVIKYDLDRPVISISFDDFPKSAVTQGASQLEAYGWRGTFYTCGGFASKTNHHGPQYAPEDLSALEAKGHEIAGHTFSHSDCTSLPLTNLKEELKKNRDALAKMGVKQPVTGFAYPYGATGLALKGQIGKEFNAVRGILEGVQHRHADLNEIKSTGLYSSTYERVAQVIQTLQEQPGWYTLFTHDISENPTEWGCTPVQFKYILESIKGSNAVVLPVRDAVKYLETQHVKA